MNNNKFPWNCGDCPMFKTYDMSIDDLTHICLWSKKQIDDCDRYQSAECPLEKHDSELLDKVTHELKETFNNECPINYTSTQPFFTLENVRTLVDMVIAEMKAEKGVTENE